MFIVTDEADTPSDSPVHEFVSDAFQSQTLSKDLKEVQEGIKRLGGTESSMKPNGIWMNGVSIWELPSSNINLLSLSPLFLE